MQVNVNISPTILDWVMTHVQLDMLSPQIVNYLNQWRSGNKTPTFNQVQKTSKATGIPLGYFFLQTPPDEDLSLVEYRTMDSVALENPSRNLIDVMHDMELVQEWTRDYLISEGFSSVPFVNAVNKQMSISDFAKFIRNTLNLTNDWFNNSKTPDESFRLIRTAMSDIGVVVMMSGIVENNTHRSLDINEFRAFAMVDDYAPLIFINSNDSINGKLFSILHEFTHICIGENSLYNDRYSNGTKVKDTESICNAVAAEILVPQYIFIDEWNNAMKEMDVTQTIYSLSQKFKCGTTVIARKALENKSINYQQYNEIAQHAVKLYNENQQKKKSKDSGGDYYRTLANRIDHRFFKMLVNSIAEGKTLYSDAFRLTNTNRSTFATLVENVGGSTNE